MKPAWDQLMNEYKNHSTILVADVDCNAAGRSLCDEVGVKGFPTIKHGDPNSMEDYNGGRSYEDLKKFASALKPMCSPWNRGPCTEEQSKAIQDFVDIGHEGREAQIKEKTEQIKQLEDTFSAWLKETQDKYDKAVKNKDAALEALDQRELGWLKAIRAMEKREGLGQAGGEAKADRTAEL